MAEIAVRVVQTGDSTSAAEVRGHRVVIDRPEAKGGVDAGMMGGELLLVGLGGCFMSNLLEAIRTRSAAISDVQVEVVGTTASGPTRYTAIAMTVHAAYDDREQMEKLVTIAERACLSANTLKQGLPLTVTVA